MIRIHFDYTSENSVENAFYLRPESRASFQAAQVSETISFPEESCFNSTVFVGGFHRAEESFKSIVSEFGRRDEYFDFRMSCCLTCLLIDISREEKRSFVVGKKDDGGIVGEIIEFIHENYNCDMTNEMIAAHFFLPPKYANDQAVMITKRNMIKFQDYFPDAVSVNGIYRYTSGDEAGHALWWQGFWCGIVWLLYEITGEAPIRCYGEKLTYNIYKLLDKQGLPHSDIGLLTVPSCIADYKFTGSTIARETAIAGYNIKENGETLFRSYFDIRTGKVSWESLGHDDFRNSPNSSRNYAWALYGLAVCYAVTRNSLYADKFYRIYTLLAARSTLDDIYHVNIFQKNGGCYDSTSSAIIAGAFLEMSRILKNEPGKAAFSADYARFGSRLLQIMLGHFAIDSTSNEEGLLKDGYIGGISSGSSESTICDDYFYLESLLNAGTERSSFWYGLCHEKCLFRF